MQKPLTLKIIIVFFLAIVLLIPITLIQGLVKSRMLLRNDVVLEIAKSSAYQQTMVGPMLVVPYKKEVTITITDRNNNNQKYQKKEIQRSELYFFPETLSMQGDLQVEKRYRGIYEARLYNTDSQITGYFKLPKNFGIEENIADYQFETPFIAIGISDIRGISNNLNIAINDHKLTVEPGTGGSILGKGIHSPINKDFLAQGGKFNFQIALKLQGTSSLNIVPVGRETDVVLKSNWPHPSFIGNFLPVKRDIAKQGFNAQWQTNFFASDMEQKLNTCISRNYCDRFNEGSFGVNLIDPVDQYLKTDRAIKYALLFIGLTFIGFFLFEVIKRLTIHPIQYSFVGVALAVFYLLLLSLSEHIGFALAYLTSAVACIALISFYVSGFMQNKKQSFGFTALLTAIYIVLYVLLSAEDYSLLMGSIFLFGLLTAAMVITRKLDWYKVASIPTLAEKKEE